MKTTLKVTAAIFLFSFIAMGCGQEKATDNNDMMHEEHMDGMDHDDMMGEDDDHDDMMEGEEDDQDAYQCPMKCEGDKTYAEAGACPKCGMDMKEVEDDDEGEE